jgi:hypothetical protein
MKQLRKRVCSGDEAVSALVHIMFHRQPAVSTNTDKLCYLIYSIFSKDVIHKNRNSHSELLGFQTPLSD